MPDARFRRPATLYAALGFALLSVGSLAHVLLQPGEWVVSSRDADTFFYFVRARRFAAEQILQGNFPLWNPHIFAGVPFLGGFQAALLYPPNVLYLLLPVDWAINLDVALHVFLFGFLTFLWIRNRGVSTVAAFYGGASMMLCGAVSVRVLAGQITVLTAASWTPLVLLAAERLLSSPTLGWTLVGIAAVTLQILAGYPLYVLASGWIVGLTVALGLPGCQERARTLAALAALAVAPLLLSAAQLWPAIATAAESLRGSGVPYWFATSFPLPPENLLTSVVPGLFGDTPNSFYWGKWKYWDACAFLGAVTVVLAAFGALRRGVAGQRRLAVLFFAICLLLALGDATPVFPFLFDHVPGFDRFRAPSKYMLHVSLFVALLAAIGLDGWLRRPNGAGRAAVAAGCAAIALGLAAFWIGGQDLTAESPPWEDFVASVVGPDTVIDKGATALHELLESDFLAETAVQAAGALAAAAALAGAIALLLALRVRFRAAAWALAGLGIAELFVFALRHHDRFELRELDRPELERFYAEHPGDYRVLDIQGRNHVMDADRLAVWGYDPVQLDRTSRLLASIYISEALRPEALLPIMFNMDRYEPEMALLRCRYVIEDWALSKPPREVETALPRLALIGSHLEITRHEALQTLLLDTFRPRDVVLLEEAPEPRPTRLGARGTVRLVDESTDHLIVEVDLPGPAILLVSDAYSSGWRALDESLDPPAELRVLPANYVMRAVALPAGRRRVRLEYSPLEYRAGVRVSVASLGAALAATALWARHRQRARRVR